MWHLLQAGGDLRLRDWQGRTPRDWAEQGDAKQSWEVLELLRWCHTHMSALVQSGELEPTVSPSQLQASSGHSLCGTLPSLRLTWADRPWIVLRSQITAESSRMQPGTRAAA